MLKFVAPAIPVPVILAAILIITGCGNPAGADPEKYDPAVNIEIPAWLELTHRKSGYLNFEFVPLTEKELEALIGRDEEPEKEDPPPEPATTGRRPNPSGSPYEPGSFADLIWQEKQRNQ